MHLATDLCLGIAGGTSKDFLYFSSQIFGSSTQSIFVHGDAPAVWLHTTLALDAPAMQSKDSMPMATEHCSPTAAAQSKSTAYLPSTTHNSGKPSGMERFAPLTDVHYSVTMEGLPIAPTH